MSIATPRPHPPAPSPPGGPPSPPPPVFSLTSAFFESPFSHTPPPRAPRPADPVLLPALRSSSVASTTSAFQLHSLAFDPAGDKPAMHDHHHHHHHHHDDALDWRVSSREWTPLSQRSSALAARQQTPAQTEDRLDRLLADMDALASPLLQCSSNIPPLDSPPLGSLAECWELHSLETRFHPFHSNNNNNTNSHPLRPCLKSRSTSVSSASSDTRSSSSDSNSTHNSHFHLPPSFQLLHHPPLDLEDDHDDDDRTVRVRFDDDSVEEFLTWSRESYDRKGPMPITKLNLREVIELKLIKEELGISPPPVLPALSPSCSSSSSSSSSSNSSTSSSPLPPPSVGPHIPSASQ